MTATCRTCGQPIPPKTGRMPMLVYCSDVCRRKSFSNTNRLPHALRGKIPVGHTFVRSDDHRLVCVGVDTVGLPVPLEVQGQ